MQLEWIGRYREVVRALVFYANVSYHWLGSKKARAGTQTDTLAEGQPLSLFEYQVLEHVCEFEQETKIMSDIAKDTGILRSNVTKAAKTLHRLGLVERFRIVGNKKNIVLKPTQAGRETYNSLKELVIPQYADFFDKLSGFTDEELELIADAIQSLGGQYEEYGNSILELID